MKQVFPLMAICIAFVFTSCEQETQSEIINSTDINTTITTNQDKPPTGDSNLCCGEENMFERQLHWLSYVTSEVLTFSPSSRTELVQYLSISGENTISVEHIIGSQSQMPILHNEIYNRLVWYYDEWTGYPNTSHTNPPFPPGSGGMPGNNTGNALVDIYFDILLNSNCIELYFPNGIGFGVNNPQITSTAHPLTTSGANEGIQFEFSSLVQEYYSSEVVVTDTYVLANDNIIVARPYRTTSPPQPNIDCSYSEYDDDLNFTHFLD